MGEVVWTTLKLAGLTTVLLLIAATPIDLVAGAAPRLVEGNRGGGHDAADHPAAVGPWDFIC